ncbi:hypothetical protein ANN_05718 [Periplaneta americana]|uniref:Uncharacterized protein n=1 Tax=Periplaneta americana TaxID=6978 RepID=A0ABQ8TDE0_PERAM|nr:hypothetical protein ANN_05718 [Periplaneta americana]
MAGLCEGGNEPPDSLKVIVTFPIGLSSQDSVWIKPSFLQQNGDKMISIKRNLRLCSKMEEQLEEEQFDFRKRNLRLRSKMEEQLEEEQFDFRKGKDTRDAIGLLRTIGDRSLEKNKEVYIVFVDLERRLTEWIAIN